jgi:hypothetical protein
LMLFAVIWPRAWRQSDSFPSLIRDTPVMIETHGETSTLITVKGSFVSTLRNAPDQPASNTVK